MTRETLEWAVAAGGRIERGLIEEVLESGQILVNLGGQPPRRALCDFLETTDGPAPALAPGDAVLVLTPATLEERGCVLGRVGRYRAPAAGAPKDVVVEARGSLTLKCGE